MKEILFYLFGVISAVLALLSVTSKNVIKGGVALLGSFISLGAVYFTVGAEFVGIIQVIVYGGAIIVLYLFALLTMDVKKIAEEKVRGSSAAAGAFLSILLMILLLLEASKIAGKVKPAVSGAKELALPLFFKYLLPFEIVSILLLVATIGAVAIARREE